MQADFRLLISTSFPTLRQILSAHGSSAYRTAAFFGDLSLAYKNILYLGMTGRNDWSTTMPEANLSAFYPSISLGFVFTELGSLKE